MKHILLSALILLTSLQAWALPQANKDGSGTIPEVVLSINDEDGVYAIGDKVTVWAEAAEDVVLKVELLDNGVTPVQSKEIKVRPGKKSVLYSKKHNEAAHMMLKVSYEGLEKPDMAGFIVAPETYTTGYDMPADFKEFWDKQKQAMRDVKQEVSLTPVSISDLPGSNGFVCYDLRISMHQGRPVRGYIVMPENAAPGSLPIVIKVHSAGVNKHFNYARPQDALSYAKYGKGCISIDINAHGIETGQPQEYYDDLYHGELQNYSSRKITGHDEYYFRLMFLRLVRTLDYACSRSEWDGKRALIVGESQGGAQAMALAGLDSRISACVATVPAMNDLGASKNGRPACWPKARDSKLNKGQEITDQVLPYYDVALHARFSKAAFWIEVGLADGTCPAPAVWSGVNGISGECNVHAYPFRTHYKPNKPYEAEWRKNIYEKRFEWMKKHLGEENL